MYRAININNSPRSLQEIRFRTELPLKIYSLNTLTSEMASTPYLATKCLVSGCNSILKVVDVDRSSQF